MSASKMSMLIKALKNRLGTIGRRIGYFGILASKESGGLRISTLTGKLEGMHSLSTSPETSSFCEKMSKVPGSICEHCFSRKSIIPELGGYKKDLRHNLIHNADWLNRPHELEDFPVLNDLYFRIESHGDIDTVLQAVNLIKFVLRNPETHFTAWTKNVIAWNEAFKIMGKPVNLIMVYSSPMVNMEVKLSAIQRIYPWIDKCFTVYSPVYILAHPEMEDKINCGTRQCLGCMLCYRHNDVGQIREIQK